MRAVIQVCLSDVGLVFDRRNGDTSKSYLYLHAKDFNCDIGLMEHGPAIQVGIHSVKVTDRQSRTVAGKDVELLSISGPCEVSWTLLCQK